jgi:hypothetical protein
MSGIGLEPSGSLLPIGMTLIVASVAGAIAGLIINKIFVLITRPKIDEFPPLIP